jgi:hypothetical protein
MDEVIKAQKQFALRDLQAALKKTNDLFESNRKALKSMEFEHP